MNVVNECRIYFKYRLSQKSPVISETKDSNSVSTVIIKDTLNIKKYVNKARTYYFNFLTYTIIICNPSMVTVTNVFFRDNISKSTKFINNSVTVNDLKKRCINLEKGFSIGEIKSGQNVIIKFKTLVLPPCIDKVIDNNSVVEYDYIYNVEKPPYRIVIESNKVTSICEYKLFKQILVDDIVKIQECIDKIISIKYNVKIIDTKIINYYQSDFSTLLVIGKISYEMCYKSHCCEKFKEDVVGYSTCILVPYGINYGNKDDIKIKVEDFSAYILDKREVHFGVSLLLYY